MAVEKGEAERRVVQSSAVVDSEGLCKVSRNTSMAISAVAGGRRTDHSDRKGLTALYRVGDPDKSRLGEVRRLGVQTTARAEGLLRET